jgi:hypothetical protein
MKHTSILHLLRTSGLFKQQWQPRYHEGEASLYWWHAHGVHLKRYVWRLGINCLKPKLLFNNY